MKLLTSGQHTEDTAWTVKLDSCLHELFHWFVVPASREQNYQSQLVRRQLLKKILESALSAPAFEPRDYD